MLLPILTATGQPKRYLMTKRDGKFIETVLEYHLEHGRHTLPWRQTVNPYRILVSEIMLQQTQVDRVVPKYRAFLKAFPTATKLASAPLGDVLKRWQGLGYNRRAKLLHECAKAVVVEHKGRWPTDYQTLQKLPGIGPYTAGAVMAFAYDEGVPLIETNVRTVYLHHFFKNQTDVTDQQILRLVAVHVAHISTRTVGPRTWYAALMDYGTHLKKIHGNPNSRAKGYVKQSTFVGSDRQIRGAILRVLTQSSLTRRTLLQTLIQFEDIRIDAQLEKLLQEEMVTKTKQTYHLPP